MYMFSSSGDRTVIIVYPRPVTDFEFCSVVHDRTNVLVHGLVFRFY